MTINQHAALTEYILKEKNRKECSKQKEGQ